MQRPQMENAIMALLVLVLLIAVVFLYKTLEAHHPPDMQGDVMLKSSPAPAVPFSP